MSYIECENLALGYEGKAVVSGLNFKVNKGDYLCVLGENGAGKSTMIKTILGLVDEIEGEIIFQRKEDYAYIPEHPTYYDELTLWEHIELVRAVHGIEDADYEERVHTFFDRAHIFV